jgi:hypothetical protein
MARCIMKAVCKGFSLAGMHDLVGKSQESPWQERVGKGREQV